MLITVRTPIVTDMKQLSLKIHGDVQGVNFRWFIKEEAQKLALVGWVRNTSLGIVEVCAEGEEEGLKELREYCMVGPRLAMVERVEEEWKEIEKRSLVEFKIVH